MTDRDLPPEQAGYPSATEGETRDTPAHAADPTPPPVPGWPPLPPSGDQESSGAHAQPSATPPPPPPWPGRTPEVPSRTAGTDAAQMPWGQHQLPGQSDAAVPPPPPEQPAATSEDPDQAPYRPSDAETTTFFDRRDFPPPPLRESPSSAGFYGDPTSGQHVAPPATPGWDSPGLARHPAPSFPQQPAPPRPQSPRDSWPGERAAAPAAGDPRQWGDPAPSPGGPPNYSYVDSIRPNELVPTRKIPPGKGWRKALFKSTFGLLNFGQSPDERRLAELEAKIRSLLRGRYKIGVLGKGGVGKTTIAAGVGSVFAELRQDDRVVAIDADTAFGKLGLRVDPNAKGSYWELAADQDLRTFADVRSRVGNNTAGLFVLAGESATARRRVLDPTIYREATGRLDNHFTLSIIDCGSTMDSPVTREVLRDLDALIVVSSMWVDGASAAAQTMELLANTGHTGLLHRTVVVLNDGDGHADKRTREVLHEQFSQRGQRVVEVPFDRHLRPGGVIDVQNEVDKVTRRRFIEIAAAIAEHFPTTSDSPRGRR
ncbi:MinD-like ATPase involved in chromosome partitioning or flagellar assembly [Mycobacterium sp. BK558]|nr:MinD-like ATPase involved in chromosome partitioning or flagellar assembly [Mycobacterium sp. BK558]